MATRDTRLVTRNRQLTGGGFPSGANALLGEAVVNLSDGILAFSGAPGGAFTTNDNATSGYFEVGSNLYDLKIRNLITSYSGQSGAGLDGKFLSGTTNGFVLANTSEISGSFTSFTVSGDTGGSQTINDGDTLYIEGGTGIDTTAAATDKITVAIDSTVATSTDTLDFFAATTSAQLASVISDETGTAGALVFSTSPTITSPTFNTSITTDYLTAGRVVYVGAGGTLTDEAGFTYNDTTNTLSTPSDGAMNVGTGGLVVGSGGGPSTEGTGDVVIHGSLTVFGAAITASTGQLYVEDNTIEINYNPTGTTNSTSLGSGIQVQDGDGAGVDLTLKVGELNTLDATEYPATTGAANRAWYTNLNDIMIRQTTDTTSPTTGKRVLAEDDILDGGTY
jgi:hypothetical protein